ncbi:HAD family hydrolase [Vibrio sp. RC27]
MNSNDILYISDLDGTLLNDDQTVSHNTQSYLATAIQEGVNFTYATARSITSSQFVLDSLNIRLPVILYNGAQIYCPIRKTYIHSAYMEATAFTSHLNQFLTDGLDPVIHCLDKEDNLRVYFRSAANKSTATWINSRLKNGDNRFRITEDFSEIDQTKVIELMVVAPQEMLIRYQDSLTNEPSVSSVLSEDIYCKGFYWLELSHRNANKGYAVKKLGEHLGINKVVTFGDNHNDIPMFEHSYRSLAMSNAQPSVREVASDVIGCNNDDAVIRYIEGQRTK